MKFKLLIAFIFIYSCSANSVNYKDKSTYNAKGFAYIYKDEDFKNKIITGSLNDSMLQVSNKNLRINTLIKIINPKTKKSVTIKNTKKIDYPDFYKILITQMVADKLNLNKDLPLVEILEIKKNKSFVAEKAKIYNEEKKISSNAPVTSVKISNISKNKIKKNTSKKDNFFILIATFYSEENAEFLKKRITNEIINYDNKKLKIIRENNKEIKLISGPYTTINFMKNDYIKLKDLGFEELDITTNE